MQSYKHIIYLPNILTKYLNTNSQTSKYQNIYNLNKQSNIIDGYNFKYYISLYLFDGNF